MRARSRKSASGASHQATKQFRLQAGIAIDVDAARVSAALAHPAYDAVTGATPVVARRPSRRARFLRAAAMVTTFAATFAGSAAGFGDVPLIRDFTTVTDSGCSGCSVVWIGEEIEAKIAGAANTVDTAYGKKDFGGTSGWAGRVWTRTILRFPQAQTINANLSVLQVRDVNDALVYEIYIAGTDRTIRLSSPAGGLRATAIDETTGVVVPNDGTTSVRIEVDALKNSSAHVRVDGIDKKTVLLFGGGATTGNQRYIRAGIDHYDGSTSGTVRVYHKHVGVTSIDRLETRITPGDVLRLLRFNTITDPECSYPTCSVTLNGSELETVIGGAADTIDTSYGDKEFGGPSGWTGRIWMRAVFRLAAGQTISDNLSIFQVRDVNNALVYEIYLRQASGSPDRELALFSPAGGLRSTAIQAFTGVGVPNDGATSVRIEVSALKNDSIIMRVDGDERIAVRNLSGGTSGNPRYFRVGFDHYDGSSTNSVTAYYSNVGVSTLEWLANRATPGELAVMKEFASVTDAGCPSTTCAVTAIYDEIEAMIGGGGDSVDTAYAKKDFGGSSGAAGRMWTRTVVRLEQGLTVPDDLSLLQVRDVNDGLVYELELASDRSLRFWSPAGGLRSTSINLSTGTVVPNDGVTSVRIEVLALKNDLVTVRVDGVDKIALTGLSGATAGNQRYLRTGIVNYGGTSTGTVRVYHSKVGLSPFDWLGQRVNDPPSVPVLDSPSAGTSVPSEVPVLRVLATDPENDPIDYYFEVASDAAFMTIVDSDWMPETNTFTVAPGALKDGETYYWRAKAADPYQESGLSGVRSFQVRLAKLGVRDAWPMWAYGPLAVNQTNGNLVLELPGPTYPTAAGSMGASVTYNSLDTANRGLGVGWTLVAGDELADPPVKLMDHSGLAGLDEFDAVELLYSDGSSDFYTHIGDSSTYLAEPGDGAQLTKNANGTWTLVDVDGSLYTFGAADATGLAALTAAES